MLDWMKAAIARFGGRNLTRELGRDRAVDLSEARLANISARMKMLDASIDVQARRGRRKGA